MHENPAFEHVIQMFPSLHTAEAEVLGPEWITQETEVLKKEEFALPPLPLFKSPMKAFYWNCCGAANPRFRRHFCSLMEEHHPHLVVITKTRVVELEASTFARVWVSQIFILLSPLVLLVVFGYCGIALKSIATSYRSRSRRSMCVSRYLTAMLGIMKGL
ncbi:hypothetical protein ACSBR2_018551 [Camellia fascicularis]